MRNVTLTISRDAVFSEVSQTTSYTGQKMSPQDYERIFTTDEDRAQLERFWAESRAQICNALKRVLQSDSLDGDSYILRLSVSEAFDPSLEPSMADSLMSFFVQSICAKWFVFTNKPDAAGYAEGAKMMIEDIKQKAFFKRRPSRPVFN